KDEMTQGVWRIFYDPNQDIFMGHAPAELEHLEELGFCFRLTRNCRNTREIAFATTFLSGVALAETLTAEGPEVVDDWSNTAANQRRAVSRILRSWIERGMDPSQIVVLSPRSWARSIVADIPPGDLPRPVVEVDRRADDRSIAFSTIHSFKGLEADAVLLVDI